MKPTKTEEKILSVRSIKELMSLILPIKEDIDELDETTTRLLTSISSGRKSTIKHISLSARIIEQGDMDVAPAAKRGVQVRTVLTEFNTPDFSDLTQDNETLKQLTEHLHELESAEQVLMSGALQSIPGRERAIKEIRMVREKARAVLDKQLQAMSKIAKKDTPKAHIAVVKDATNYITNQLDASSYSAISRRTFVYPNKTRDQLMYQTFIMIGDFENQDGDTYDRYSIVLTGVLDLDSGELIHYITSSKDHLIPGSFKIGPAVDTSAQMKRRISDLFNVDSFMVRGVRKTLGSNTMTLRKNTELPEISAVNRVRVFNNTIYVELKRSLTDEQEKIALNDIRAAIRRIFARQIKRSNSLTYRKETSRRNGAPIYAFNIVPSNPSDTMLSVRKLNQIRDALNLSPDQVETIKQAII